MKLAGFKRSDPPRLLVVARAERPDGIENRYEYYLLAGQTPVCLMYKETPPCHAHEWELR